MAKPPAPGDRLPAWAAAEGPFGIRLLDVGIVLLIIAVIELNVAVGGGYGAAPLNGTAYLLGAVIALPVLFRNRWPLRVLLIAFLAMMLYYSLDRRNISPAPLLGIPVYDVAVAGYLAWAITIPAIVMGAGLVAVGLTPNESAIVLVANFVPSIVLFVLAVMLGEVVRTRRALAQETARRLLLAEEERTAEAGRLIAEERLRIARELHDTVAHSMATITVQAGSALHLLTSNPDSPVPEGEVTALRSALTAIRETSKSALSEMRSVLGELRSGDGKGNGIAAPDSRSRTGLDRLTALRDAVSAAGARVTVSVEGDPVALSAETDHAAYRILQESLTNVLRHAGQGAAATVRLCYRPGSLALSVTDDGVSENGSGSPHGSGSGHGISGMKERATAVGGTLTAGRKPGGGFEVLATLPTGAAGESA